MSVRRRELPLGSEDTSQGRASGWLVSLVVHLGIAGCLALVQVAPPQAVRRWVEMVVTETPEAEPEPPPPPPEPELPKPPRPPKVVEYTAEPTLPDPVAPPDTPTQSVRRVQGLNSASFLPGSGSGVAARAGTSLTVKATEETMTREEATVSWAAATSPPRCPRPALEAPATVKKAGIQGSVEVLLDVGADGKIDAARVTRPLHPDADAACLAAWSAVRCTPGKVGNDAVGVAGLPHTCTFRAVE